MSAATLTGFPTVLARTASELRGYRHGVETMARRGWIKNPSRLLGRISDQLAARDADIEALETPVAEPVRTDEESQLDEEELRDRNLLPSPATTEAL